MSEFESKIAALLRSKDQIPGDLKKLSIKAFSKFYDCMNKRFSLVSNSSNPSVKP